MKRGKKMFIIILTTLGVLGFISWGIITYLGRSQTLSIKSIENPSRDLYLVHITKPKIKYGKLAPMLSLSFLTARLVQTKVQ